MNSKENPHPIVLLMGVSGCGKSTIGRLLAGALGCELIDGDDHHPPANVAKMSAGIPLDDADRLPWLEKLAGLMRGRIAANRTAVVACSALKRKYRDVLRVDPLVTGFLLHASEQVLQDRMAQRTHWFDSSLLHSQFETLEMPEPDERIAVIDVRRAPDEVVREILAHLD
jgi:gluconokinase